MAALMELSSPPEDHSITPRPVKFNITDDSPRFWFDKDPFKTHFFNAFFTTFPPGEEFFVRSVLNYRNQIADEKLQEDITAFASQEGSHANAHQDHLEILDRQGYTSLKRENKIIDVLLKFMTDKFPKISLINTLALEHFTALLAHQAFTDPELFCDPAHEDFLPLFKWHGAEEIEHKAVAYDVYMSVDGRYWPRVVAMLFATVTLVLILPIRMSPLLFHDGLLFKWSTWRNGLPFLFGGKKGLFTKPWRHYVSFYQRNFHPWDVQDYEYIRQVQQMYDAGTLLDIGKKSHA